MFACRVTWYILSVLPQVAPTTQNTRINVCTEDSVRANVLPCRNRNVSEGKEREVDSFSLLEIPQLEASVRLGWISLDLLSHYFCYSRLKS